MKEDISVHLETIENVEREKSTLSQTVQYMEHENGNLSQKHDALDRENGALSQKLDDLGHEKVDVSEKVDTLTEEHCVLTEKVELLEIENENLSEIVKGLDEEKRDVSQKLEMVVKDKEKNIIVTEQLEEQLSAIRQVCLRYYIHFICGKILIFCRNVESYPITEYETLYLFYTMIFFLPSDVFPLSSDKDYKTRTSCPNNFL